MSNTSRLRIEPLEDRITPAAGDFDPTFGTGGIAVVPGSDLALRVEILANGDLAAITSSGKNHSVVAYLPNGTPDAGFGVAGRVDFPGVSLTALAAHTDGKLLVAGTTSTGQVVVTRLTAAGLPDPGFGNGGTANSSLDGDSGTIDVPSSVAVGPGGMVVVAGRVGGDLLQIAPASFAATRLLADGQVDGSFGTSGFAVVPFPSGSFNTAGANAVAVQADGSVVMAGVAASGNSVPVVNSDLAVVRLTSNGSLDPTFGSGGRLRLPRDPAATAVNMLEDVAIRPDGKIMIAGVVSAVNGVSGNFGTAARLNPDGTLDSTYGIGGQGYTKDSLEYGASIGPDGTVVFSGGPIVRLTDYGFQDTRFNLGSRPIAGDLHPSSGTFQTDGQIILSGQLNNGGFLARLESNGPPPNFFPTAPGVIVATGFPNAGSFQPLTPTGGTYSSHGSIGAFVGQQIGARGTTAEVTGDGIPDYIVGAGPGGLPQITVFDGQTGNVVADFLAFEPTFTGGVFVAAADLDGDLKAELVISPDQGGGPRVVVFSIAPGGAAIPRASFFGFEDPNFRGGARVALGDVNNDTVPDLAVAAGFLGGPRVALLDGSTILGGSPAHLVNDFFAFPGTDSLTLRNGTYVAMGDLNGDGFADLIFGGGPGGAPRVFILSGQTVSGGDVAGAQANPLANFFVAGNTTNRGGVRVASTNADGDSKEDLVVGSGEGAAANVRVYLGKNITSSSEPGTSQDISVFGGATLPGGVYVG